MQLHGAGAVVTGGASGLGLAVAEALIERGASVRIVDLATSDGEGVAARLGCEFAAADITDDSELEAAFADKEIRAVVHCAGRWGAMRVLDRDGRARDRSQFEDILRVNLVGTYNVLRLAAAAMAVNVPVDEERGAVVLTSSVAGFEGQAGQISYAASKAGINGMTLPAARDLASWQIRVNTIAPGIFDTPMVGGLPDERRDDTSLSAGVVHPKRVGRPHEFGAMVVSTLENTYLNGETIRLDGGLRMVDR